MPFCPWRTDSFLPKETMTHPAPSCALETYNMIFFTLRPLPARTEAVLSQQCAIRGLRCCVRRENLFIKSICASAPRPPYIPSPQWRPSGTGNSLLCIAVLLCRSISAPQRRTHSAFFSPSPDTRVIHAPTCDVVLTFEAEIGKFSMHCPHGTPGPGPQHPAAHPSERPVRLNFSIGGKWKSDAVGWEPRFACDWSMRGCWWEGCRHHADILQPWGGNK